MTSRPSSARPAEPAAPTGGTPAGPPVPAPRPSAGAAEANRPATDAPGGAVPETRVERAVGRAFRQVTAAAHAPYQTAVIRIGFALTWLLFLLHEWPHRQELYGPDGTFSIGMARQLLSGDHAFSVLLWSDSQAWFTLVYVVAVVSAVLLLVGWRTRTMAVLFMVTVLSLLNRSVWLGDGGDNVLHIMSMYLVLVRCGQVWSLDARRARRAGGRVRRDVAGVVLWAVLGLVLLVAQLAGAWELSWFHDGPLPLVGWSLALWGIWAAHAVWWAAQRRGGSAHRRLLEVVTRLLHNGALLVIMAEVCVIYSTAGWYKVQGARWQDGTAVYYPMHLNYFSPWPELSRALGDHGDLMMLAAYVTVIVQVAFPFTLFQRRVKNVLLVGMICEHLSIAVLLGLPFFSLAMITADAVFLPTSLLTGLGRRVAALSSRYRPGTAGGGAPARAPSAREDGAG